MRVNKFFFSSLDLCYIPVHKRKSPMATTAEAPETFDALRQRIRDRFPNLSPHLQRIARASLEEPNGFALNTTSVIAEGLDIQPSTLIRFAKEFGYGGFSDLQRVFRQRLIEGEASVRDQVLEAAGTTTTDMREVLDACIDAHQKALSKLRDSGDVAAMTSAVQMLRSARHVYVAGLRRSRPIADYLVYGLIRGERACSTIDFAGGMAGPQVATISPEDVLVAIAFPPYSKPVVDLVMDAHVAGRRIVGITDVRESPLARYSDASLLVESDTASRFQPISGVIALVQALLMAVTQP
jgi:DNA-binding MurR/RpiR family transcriptional regulator